MKERLVELLAKKYDHYCDQCGVNKDSHYIENLADHLIKNGVIVPPFKIGQIVYVIRSKTSNGKNLYLREERIDHYRVFSEWTFMCFESGRMSVPEYDWCNVFLTREEAEKKLVNYESSKNDEKGK